MIILSHLLTSGMDCKEQTRESFLLTSWREPSSKNTGHIAVNILTINKMKIQTMLLLSVNLMIAAPLFSGETPADSSLPKTKEQASFTFTVTSKVKDDGHTEYSLQSINDNSHGSLYSLPEYLAALEQFLKQKKEEGFPVEQISMFTQVPFAQGDLIQEQFKQLARDGKSRVSTKDGHYMNVCRRLIKEEKMLQPYKEVFNRFGLDVDDLLLGDSKIGREPLDIPGRKSPVYYFTGGRVNLKIKPLIQEIKQDGGAVASPSRDQS